MKKIIYTVLSIILTIVWMTGCTNEHPVSGGNEPQEGVAANISLAPGIKAFVSGSHLDATVNQLRVMMFDAVSGRLVTNQLITNFSTDQPETVSVRTGKYHFVFIANENSEPAASGLSTLLNGLVIGSAGLSDLENLYFSIGAFDTDKYIPMVKMMDNVTIRGENTVVLNGNTAPEEVPWRIPLVRLAVRLDVTFTLTTEEYNDVLAANNPPMLTLSNMADRVFMFNSDENHGIGTSVTKNIIFDESDNTNKQDILYISPGAEPKVTLKFDRIIIPENIFTPKDDPNKAVEMSMQLAGSTNYMFKGKVGLDMVSANRDYTLLRNNYLAISALLRLPNIDMTADVNLWDEVNQNIIIDEQFYMKADKNNIRLTGGTPATITIETDYDGSTGYEEGSILAPNQPLPDWLTVTPGTQTVNGRIYQRTYTLNSSLNITANGVFYIQAGNMRYGVKVQLQPGMGVN